VRPAPVASYRLQLTPERGFGEVATRLDRLAQLGISHVYLSPVTEATPGSEHGYDVVDHTTVRAELGGVDALGALLDALADHDMAAIVDHVPNHTAVGVAEQNRRWWELLRDGPGSPADRWFDVDWAAADGQVLLPLLDRPLADVVAGAAVTATSLGGEPVLVVGDHRLPMAAGTAELSPADALARQHWRLVEWRRPERNVRRFFAIDGLAAVRVEHPEVADAVDTVPRLLVEHDAFGGLRIDHVDGLADPLAYLQRVRDLIGGRWLVVEKILAPGETLPPNWPVDGTTGYEHARLLEHALLDTDGWRRLAARWAAAVGDDRPFRDWELDARREVLDGPLRPDRDRVARLATAVLGRWPPDEVAAAVNELSAHLRRYRTYLPADDDGRRALDAARDETVDHRPDLAGAVDALLAVIDDPPSAIAVELRTRWQQLTGPATAKGVEDRAFWRYVPLASLGEVGGHPEVGHDADPVTALHTHHATVAARWPVTINAGTTHDAARSEDVRATGLVLADAVDAFGDVVDEWRSTASFADLDPAVQWLALQTVATTPDLTIPRLEAFLVKAAREADQSTSWTEPDHTYEQRLAALGRDVLAWPTLIELAAAVDRPGRARTLAMLAVRVTAPGVPDVYQGTEAFRFLLVDPDNRTTPHDEELDRLVAGAGTTDGRAAWADPIATAARAVTLRRLLALRRRQPEAFGPGSGYALLPVVAGDGVIAFARLDAAGDAVVVTVAARRSDPAASVELPPGTWRHVLVDGEETWAGRIELARLLAPFPAAVLVRA
jgi:(1->4)-alpha-D-glucan 1-alpha-D-glucosylmutase